MDLQAISTNEIRDNVLKEVKNESSVVLNDREYLLTFDLVNPVSNFGRDGRIKHSKELVGIWS